jgi:diacylglycerol kinase family enzyme
VGETVEPGVLVNAGAGRVRRDPSLVGGLRALVPPGRVFATKHPDEIEPALARLRADGVDSLAVVGGDGTVTAALTALARAWPAHALPRVALLPGGSVNTIPSWFSGPGAPDRILARLLRAADDPRECVCEPLEVRTADGPARIGMIFGNGAVCRWLDLYHAQPRRGPTGAAAVLTRALVSVATGGALSRELFRPFEAAVEIDGAPAAPASFTAMAAGALPVLGLGFRPFFHAGTERGAFHFITTDSRPWELGLDFPAARFGRRRPGTRLRDHRARAVRIVSTEPQGYTIDGDVFPPAPCVELRAGPSLRIWVP